MKFIIYLFSSAIAYFGLVAGFILIKIAPEEKKQLVLVFKSVKLASIALAFLFAFFYFHKNLFELLSLISYAALVIFFELRSRDYLRKLLISYATLAVVFFLSSVNTNLFLITSSLIFIYGAAAASLADGRKKNLMLNGSIFLVLSWLLFTTSRF